jgi:hypothetical protein
MKIKLAYPKIPDTLHCPLKRCIAFEKIDGTNIHWVWTPETGFHSFGTRRDRYPNTDASIAQFHKFHYGLGGLDDAFKKIAQPLSEFLLNKFPDSKEVVVFSEFYGANSFAGSHKPEDKKQLFLLDVQVDGKMLPPEEFIQLFEPFGIPKVIFRGKFTGQLYADVRSGKYGVKEGVVVKGVVNGEIYMAKIKTSAYAKQLMERFKGDWKNYWE